MKSKTMKQLSTGFTAILFVITFFQPLAVANTLTLEELSVAQPEKAFDPNAAEEPTSEVKIKTGFETEVLTLATIEAVTKSEKQEVFGNSLPEQASAQNHLMIRLPDDREQNANDAFDGFEVVGDWRFEEGGYEYHYYILEKKEGELTDQDAFDLINKHGAAAVTIFPPALIITLTDSMIQEGRQGLIDELKAIGLNAEVWTAGVKVTGFDDIVKMIRLIERLKQREGVITVGPNELMKIDLGSPNMPSFIEEVNFRNQDEALIPFDVEIAEHLNIQIQDILSVVATDRPDIAFCQAIGCPTYSKFLDLRALVNGVEKHFAGVITGGGANPPSLTLFETPADITPEALDAIVKGINFNQIEFIKSIEFEALNVCQAMDVCPQWAYAVKVTIKLQLNPTRPERHFEGSISYFAQSDAKFRVNLSECRSHDCGAISPIADPTLKDVKQSARELFDETKSIMDNHFLFLRDQIKASLDSLRNTQEQGKPIRNLYRSGQNISKQINDLIESAPKLDLSEYSNRVNQILDQLEQFHSDQMAMESFGNLLVGVYSGSLSQNREQLTSLRNLRDQILQTKDLEQAKLLYAQMETMAAGLPLKIVLPSMPNILIDNAVVVPQMQKLVDELKAIRSEVNKKVTERQVWDIELGDPIRVKQKGDGRIVMTYRDSEFVSDSEGFITITSEYGNLRIKFNFEANELKNITYLHSNAGIYNPVKYEGLVTLESNPETGGLRVLSIQETQFSGSTEKQKTLYSFDYQGGLYTVNFTRPGELSGVSRYISKDIKSLNAVLLEYGFRPNVGNNILAMTLDQNNNITRVFHRVAAGKDYWILPVGSDGSDLNDVDWSTVADRSRSAIRSLLKNDIHVAWYQYQQIPSEDNDLKFWAYVGELWTSKGPGRFGINFRVDLNPYKIIHLATEISETGKITLTVPMPDGTQRKYRVEVDEKGLISLYRTKI